MLTLKTNKKCWFSAAADFPVDLRGGPSDPADQCPSAPRPAAPDWTQHNPPSQETHPRESRQSASQVCKQARLHSNKK